MITLEALSHRWAEIDELLDEGLDLLPGERPAWLAELSGDRVELRDVVRELLEVHAHVETASFMSALPLVDVPAGGARAGDEAVAGDSVGPYRLISALGHGGMGTVWLAERSDGQLNRRVAVKLPRLAWGSAVAERLARERDILATLAHPNIARLYDAGVDRHGRPYLAMELVDGQTIDVYCAERRLSVHERLRLLLQVAAAVAHAHARLVVHRDLKPANILVTPQAQVRLLDFGIAKLMEGDRTRETALTRMSGRALTLDYASPEQIRGEPLGTASDVYSLAVVAYELLSGARPYRLKRGSAAELEEAIASVEPPLASDVAAAPPLRKQLRGDLDAILQHALRKDAADRYPGVEAFAQDIEQHLAGLPVRAVPDSRLYRLRKFVARNRLGVASAATVGVAVIAGTGVASWQAVVANMHAGRAERALEQQEVVRQMYTETLASVAGWDTATFARPNSVTGLLRAKLAELEPHHLARPQNVLALRKAMSQQLSFSGDFEGSLEVGRTYLALLKETGAAADLVIDAHASLANNLDRLGRRAESEAMARAAMAWAPDDTASATRHSRLVVASSFGDFLVRDGRREEGARVLLEAEAVASRYFAGDRDRLMNLHRLSLLHVGFDDALAVDYAQQAHRGLLAAPDTEQEQLNFSFARFGSALLANGQLAEATPLLEEAYERSRLAHGDDDVDVSRNLGRVAAVLARSGDHARVRKLLADRAQRPVKNPGERGGLVMIRGRQLENEMLFGDLQAAAAFVAPLEPAVLADPNVRGGDIFLAHEANWLMDTNRAAEAKRRLDAAQQILKPSLRQTAVGFRLAAAKIRARLLLAEGVAAAEEARALVTAMRTAGATRTWSYQEALELAALAAARRGERDDAARLLTQSAGASPPLNAPSRVERADSWLRRAQAWAALGRPADAADAAAKALADLAVQHPGSPRLALARSLAGA